MGRAAKKFARIIRRDASREYQSVTSKVSVVVRSDGVKALRVHYRRLSFTIPGEYVLKLETRRGVVVGVGLEESSEAVESIAPYSNRINTEKWSFDIARAHENGQHGWLASVAYHNKTSMMVRGKVETSEEAPTECIVPHAYLPVPLYKKVLAILQSVSEEQTSRFVRPRLGVCEEQVSIARAAKTFVRIIRQDATREYHKGSVTVTLGSDGVKVLRVHYSIAPAGFVTSGEYVLRLESFHRRLVGVAVEESSSGMEVSAERTVTGSANNTLELNRYNPRGVPGWTWSFTHHDRTLTNEADGNRFGVAGGDECPIMPRMSGTLYVEVLNGLKAAADHKASAFEWGPSICSLTPR